MTTLDSDYDEEQFWRAAHPGQTFDEFLTANGVGKKNILAFRRVVAWRISETMTARGISTGEQIFFRQ
jgi:hypothetical protein